MSAPCGWLTYECLKEPPVGSDPCLGALMPLRDEAISAEGN
jgi:hypothetical protein